MKKSAVFTIFIFCILFINCTPEDFDLVPGFSDIQLPDSVPEEMIVLQVSGLIDSKETVLLDLETIMSFKHGSMGQ